MEAAELMEHFLWVESEASRSIVHDRAWLAEVADEMADVACQLLNLANVLGIDLTEAVRAKVAKNALKYPAEEYRGRSGGKSEESRARVERKKAKRGKRKPS